MQARLWGALPFEDHWVVSQAVIFSLFLISLALVFFTIYELPASFKNIGASWRIQSIWKSMIKMKIERRGSVSARGNFFFSELSSASDFELTCSVRTTLQEAFCTIKQQLLKIQQSDQSHKWPEAINELTKESSTDHQTLVLANHFHF